MRLSHGGSPSAEGVEEGVGCGPISAATLVSEPAGVGGGAGAEEGAGAGGVVGPAAFAEPESGPFFRSQAGSSGPAAMRLSGLALAGWAPSLSGGVGPGTEAGVASGAGVEVMLVAAGATVPGSGVFVAPAEGSESATGMGVAVGTSVALCPGSGMAMGGDEGLPASAVPGSSPANSDGDPIAGVPDSGEGLVSLISGLGGACAGAAVSCAGRSSDRAPGGAFSSQMPRQTSNTRNTTTPTM